MSEWTKERIEKAQELSIHATNLKWIVESGEYTGENWLIGSVYLGVSSADNKEYWVHITTDNVHASQLHGDAKIDAEYILEACNNYPDALSEIERLQSEVAKPQEELDAIKIADRRDADLAANLYLKNQKLRSQRDRLVNASNGVLHSLRDRFDEGYVLQSIIDEITAEGE